MGVHQAPVVRPLLFFVFVNDQSETCKYTKITLLADDTSIVNVFQQDERLSYQDDLNGFQKKDGSK